MCEVIVYITSHASQVTGYWLVLITYFVELWCWRTCTILAIQLFVLQDCDKEPLHVSSLLGIKLTWQSARAAHNSLIPLLPMLFTPPLINLGGEESRKHGDASLSKWYSGSVVLSHLRIVNENHAIFQGLYTI